MTSQHPRRTSTSTVAARERERRVLELRMEGRSLQEVADELGYADRSGAHRAITRALARHVHEAVDEMRTIEGARLDKVQAVLWPLVQAGDLAAIDRLLKVMQRRANLFGLDLAGRIDVIAGGEVDLDEAVARIMAVVHGQQPTTDQTGE